MTELTAGQQGGDPFDTPQAEIPRDHVGRPLVTPPNGGKPIAYTRCTTYVGCLEDMWNLHKWDERNVALGLADRPDLLLAVSAHRDDKDELNAIVADAKEAAKAKAAATIGTSLHALTERLDRGQALGVVPAAYQADIRAYEQATAGLEIVGIERFTVLDDLKIGGTHDRTIRYQGTQYISDLKTGSIEYAALKIAMQLAVYSRSVLYDHQTSARTSLDVDQDRALVIHLPAGTGRCQRHWVDIAAGWEAVQVATQVREWRRRKGLITPFDIDWPARIRNAGSVDELYAIHADAVALKAWGEPLLIEAKQRKAELTEER